VERIDEPGDESFGGPRPVPERVETGEKVDIIRRPPRAPGGPGGVLGGILNKLGPGRLEIEDYILMLIMYLLYRESGDTELLMILAAYFLS